jgi:hypothetical protein
MKAEVIVAIVTLVAALPPTLYIMNKWYMRQRQKSSQSSENKAILIITDMRDSNGLYISTTRHTTSKTPILPSLLRIRAKYHVWSES